MYKKQQLPNLLGIFLFFTLLYSIQPVNAQNLKPNVLVLKANSEVAPAMRDYIARGIKTAQDQKAELLVIELNTPGGFIASMTEIVTSIRGSHVPVVVFITPGGAMAASAGTLITLAGHAAAMSPETIIGAASPVGSQGQDLESTMKSKEIEALTAMVRSIAERRSPTAIKMAEETIRNARAVSSKEAMDAKLVDFIATDLNDLLRQLNGFSIQIDSQTRILQTTNATVSEIPIDLAEQILDILVKTDTVFLLMAMGLLAILIELSAPGGWVAGFLGVIAMALSVYGFGILTVNWFGVIFIIVSFVLFFLDLQTPTHGALTTAGIGSFILGTLVLFNSTGVPEFQRVSIPLVVTVGVIIGLGFAILLGFGLRAQSAPITMGQDTLIGVSGIARGNIDPLGQVQLKSELWSAERVEGSAPINSGDRVIVENIEGLRLKVRKDLS